MNYVHIEPFLPNDEHPIEAQSAEALLAMTLWGEARGGTVEAKVAVASVILNRMAAKAGRFFPLSAATFNDRLRGVVLRPKQFSCFNGGDPNRALLLRPEVNDALWAWQECILVAAGACAGLTHDPTKGADHYFSPVYGEDAEKKIVVKNTPPWAKGHFPTLTLRGFQFYKIG